MKFRNIENILYHSYQFCLTDLFLTIATVMLWVNRRQIYKYFKICLVISYHLRKLCFFLLVDMLCLFNLLPSNKMLLMHTSQMWHFFSLNVSNRYHSQFALPTVYSSISPPTFLIVTVVVNLSWPTVYFSIINY